MRDVRGQLALSTCMEGVLAYTRAMESTAEVGMTPACLPAPSTAIHGTALLLWGEGRKRLQQATAARKAEGGQSSRGVRELQMQEHSSVPAGSLRTDPNSPALVGS